MRDIAVLSIVAVAALMTLRRPWIGVMLWTWLSIMSPHRYTWGFAYSAPVAAVAAGVTLLALLYTRERQWPFQGPPMVWFALLSGWVTLSWLMGMDVAGDYEQWNKVMKIYLMTFVAAALLSSRFHIMAFAWVTVGSLALLAAKGGLFTILSGGVSRVYGPAGSFIEENNAFGLAVLTTIPLMHFLQLQLKTAWMRHAMSAVMLLSAASALGSHSRGALLALIAMGAVFWLRSQRKGLIGVMILIVFVVLLPIMPEAWWDRMATIQTYEEDTSAMGRINAWHVAWQVALHNFFGGGMSYQHQILFILYGPYGDTVLSAHSNYFQMLGNHGFIGLFLFLALGVSTFRTATWLRRNARSIPEAQWAADLGSMVQVGLVGFAVGGAFLNLAYFDLPYNMMVMVVLAKAWVQREAWKTEKMRSLHEQLGLRKRSSQTDMQGNVNSGSGESGTASGNPVGAASL